MSSAYDEYLAEHISNVSKGLQWMLDNIWLSQEEKSAVEDAMTHQHDASKYDTEEYEAYDKYFYGGNRSYNVVQDFNYAWLHHIHKNPHHWQYWVLLEDDPEEEGRDSKCQPGTGEYNAHIGKFPIKTLLIPLPYIFEMIADWWTFSWKEENLFEIFNWYADHRAKQYIHPESREIVEYILIKIWKTLIMQETIAGHDISEIEKQYKRFWAEQDVDLLNWDHPSAQVIGKVINTRETENGLEITVEHSGISEDDEDLYGVPELKKFPMPDKKHVKSAIRFFNYVDPKYEKELAEAIIEKAKEFGLDLKNDITIGDENMFKKYIMTDDENDSKDRVLTHYGIKGQTWGERRFQYADGSLTPEGRKRYLKESKLDPSNKKDTKKSDPLFDISKLGKGTYTPPGAPGPNGRVGGGSANESEEPNYDPWEKDLYAEFEKTGMNPANMSDADFKALLIKKGILKDGVADSLVMTMKQKAMKNYKIYSKKNEPAKTDDTATTTNTEENSSKKSKKSKASDSSADTETGSSRRSKNNSESDDNKVSRKAEDEADIYKLQTKEKPSIDTLERNITSKIERLSKLKKDAITLGDILNDDMDGFIAKISDLIDDDISGLSYKELKELRERLQKQYEDSNKEKESENDSGDKKSENEAVENKEEEKKEK